MDVSEVGNGRGGHPPAIDPDLDPDPDPDPDRDHGF